jgi:hypothetical protein
MLAAQQGGGGSGSLAEGLARSVKNVPLADDVALVCHKSGHGETSIFVLYMNFVSTQIQAPHFTCGAFCIIMQEFQGVNDFF